MRAVLHNCTDRSSSWEHNMIAGQKISVFPGTRNVITLFTIGPHWTLAWATCIQSTSSYITLKTYLNIVLLHMPRTSRWPRLFRFAGLLCHRMHDFRFLPLCKWDIRSSIGSYLPTFRYNLSVPVLNPLKMGLIGCPKTSVNKYQSTLRNMAERRKPHVIRSFYYASQSTNTNDRRNNPHSSFSQTNR
jgi:hypothetical protein